MKQYDVYLMPDAIGDLEEIYNYIAEQSGFRQRAWSYIEKLHHKCQELRTALIRGQKRDDLMDGLRIYPLDKKLVVAFLVNEESLTIKILNIY